MYISDSQKVIMSMLGDIYLLLKDKDTKINDEKLFKITSVVIKNNQNWLFDIENYSNEKLPYSVLETVNILDMFLTVNAFLKVGGLKKKEIGEIRAIDKNGYLFLLVLIKILENIIE